MYIKKGEVRYLGRRMLLQDKDSTILIYGAHFWFDTKMILRIERSINRGFLLIWNPNNNNVSLRCALITQYSTHKKPHY